MAISLSKFVDIRTTWPESNPEQRALGGLVFTTDDCASSASDSTLKTEIEKNGPVALDEEEIKYLFGESSDVYKFAKRYYGYYNLSNRTSSPLKVVKLKAEETPKDALIRVAGSDNGFGSFVFIGDFDENALAEVYKENGKSNTSFLAVHCIVAGDTDDETSGKYTVSSAADKCSTGGTFNGIEGLCVVYGNDKYTAAIPMAIFASTDYDGTNSVVCQMFKQHDDEIPTVTNDDDYNMLTKAHVNFYGTTQSNGKTISFYMPGYNVDGTDTAIYCNEIWFKSLCTTNLVSMLVENGRIPANDDGVTMVKNVVLDACVPAATAGVFMAKTPTKEERRRITAICAMDDYTDAQTESVVASVETNGYGVVAYLGKNVDGDRIIEYYVFYGTADSIRAVKGNDLLVSGE